MKPWESIHKESRCKVSHRGYVSHWEFVLCESFPSGTWIEWSWLADSYGRWSVLSYSWPVKGPGRWTRLWFLSLFLFRWRPESHTNLYPERNLSFCCLFLDVGIETLKTHLNPKGTTPRNRITLKEVVSNGSEGWETLVSCGLVQIPPTLWTSHRPDRGSTVSPLRR